MSITKFDILFFTFEHNAFFLTPNCQWSSTDKLRANLLYISGNTSSLSSTSIYTGCQK